MSLLAQLTIALFLAIGAAFLASLTFRYNVSRLFQFAWGDKNVSGWDAAHLLTSTGFALNGLVYFFWLGYVAGYWSLVIQVFWCGSYFLLAPRAGRVKELSEFGSLHGSLRSLFGSWTGRIAAIASLLGFILTIGWELTLCATLFRVTAEDNPGLSQFIFVTIMICLAIACAFYTINGGLRGNIRANRIQNFLFGISLLLLVVYLATWRMISPTGSNTNLAGWSKLVAELTVGGLVANITFSLFFQFVDMSNWQTLAATEGQHTKQKKALMWTGVWLFVFPGLLGSAVGIGLNEIANLDSTTIYTQVVKSLSDQPILSIVIFVGFISGMLSTIDGLALAASQSAVWDLTHRQQVSVLLEHFKAGGPEMRYEAEQAHILRWMRLWIFLVLMASAVSGIALELWSPIKLFDLIYVSFSAQLALVGPVLAVLYATRRNDGRNLDGFGVAAVGAGLLFGVGACLYFVATKQLHLVVWGPIFAVVISALLVLPTWRSWKRISAGYRAEIRHG